MKEKTVKDIVDSLSIGERELHKDLIEECILREANVNEYVKTIKDNMEKLPIIKAKLMEDLETIYDHVTFVNNKLQEVKFTIHLNSIADEDFHEA